MADPFTDLTISGADEIAIPVYPTLYRTDLPESQEFTWDQVDNIFRSLHILNFNLVPQTSTDQIVRITGGSVGQWICVRPKTPGDEIEFVHSANLILPFSSNLSLRSPNELALFVNLGGDVYAKPV